MNNSCSFTGRFTFSTPQLASRGEETRRGHPAITFANLKSWVWLFVWLSTKQQPSPNGTRRSKSGRFIVKFSRHTEPAKQRRLKTTPIQTPEIYGFHLNNFSTLYAQHVGWHNFDPIVDGALLLSLRHFDPRPQRGFEGGGDAQALPKYANQDDIMN